MTDVQLDVVLGILLVVIIFVAPRFRAVARHTLLGPAEPRESERLERK